MKKSTKSKIDLEFEEVFLKIESWRRGSTSGPNKETRSHYLNNLIRLKNILGSLKEEPIRVIT